MANPSTADDNQDDPTIRKVLGFSKIWGVERVDVVNLYAMRSTDVNVLKTAADPVGRYNAFFIEELAKRADYVICAWGAKEKLPKSADVIQLSVRDIFYEINKPTYCLGLTVSGYPKHPLMLAYKEQKRIFQ